MEHGTAVQLNNNVTALWSLELFVYISYEEFYERSRDSTLSTQLPPVSCSPDNDRGTEPVGAKNSTTFIAGIAVLVVLQAATIIALISTCVVFKRKLKQR